MSSSNNRPNVDVFIEAGAASIYGSMMGLEVESGGNMAITGALLDLALSRFMDDVFLEGGPGDAAVYAARLMTTLAKYLPKAPAMPEPAPYKPGVHSGGKSG